MTGGNFKPIITFFFLSLSLSLSLLSFFSVASLARVAAAVTYAFTAARLLPATTPP
jgi:hypothetical protein